MRTLIAFALVLLPGFALAEEPNPWPFSELKHRRHYAVDVDDKNPLQTCVVAFSTGGVMHPKGRDLRVMAAGKQMPFRILQIGPGTFCRIAFKVAPPVKDYYVFYGSDKASAVDGDWAVEPGLVLETRHFNGGGMGSLDEILKAVKESGPSFGSDVVPNVFHGHNPFGPSDQYVSIYRGALWIKEPGSYVFATTSDDASVMRVDGSVVASKYGEGPAVGDIRFMGKATALAAGRHEFEYYHVEGKGEQAAVAAWKPPGGKWSPIPAEAFGRVHRGKLADYAIRGQALAPDLEAVNAGEVIFRGKYMIRFSFRNVTTDPEIFQYQPRWDFGDGTRAETVNPEHVYFDFGTYEVSLTLTRGGKSFAIRHTIIVDEGWERQTLHCNDDLNRYVGLISGYQFERMNLSAIDRALDVFEELKAHAQLLRAAAIAVSKHEKGEIAADKPLDESLYLRHCLLLADALCKEKTLRDKPPAEPKDESRKDEWEGVDLLARAVQVLADCEGKLHKPENRVKAALKRGDVCFYFLRDLDKARDEYQRCLKTYGGLQGPEPRIAQIRLGDYYRKLGKTAEARENYRIAAAMAIERPFKNDAARVGALQESAENYLRRDELDAAREQLDTWEWEFPEAKLDSRSSIIRSELALKEKNADEALAQLQDFATGNKDGPLAPEALLRIAELRVERDEFEQALQACSAIAGDYLDSPLKEDAGFLAGECLLKAGSADKALARLEEMAATYPDSDHLPQALLVMGDCHRKLGREEKARELWQQVVKKYPDSSQRKAAEERLAARPK